MEIPNPRRVLAVSSADQSLLLSQVVRDLTGVIPEPSTATSDGPSLAGTTHHLALKTPYYTTSLPIWLDIIADPVEWAASFLSPEAKEVLDVLGGVAVVFPVGAPQSSASPATTGEEARALAQSEAESRAQARALLEEVGRVVREGLGGWEWDGVALGIGVGSAPAEVAEEWEDLCAGCGLEFVQVRGGAEDEGRNEFGEKMGIPRVREALESNDWAQATMDDSVGSEFGALEGPSAAGSKPDDQGDGGSNGEDFDPDDLDFGFDRADFEGLKKAIWGLEREGEAESDAPQPQGDDSATKREPLGEQGPAARTAKTGAEAEGEDLDERDVERLEGMMQKLLAVRDMSAGMPDEQRKRMAARAVGEVMRDL